MAGKPGPAPRAAQRSSLFWVSEQCSFCPVAVTTSTATTCSQDQPQFYLRSQPCERGGLEHAAGECSTLQFQPIPPCKRNPSQPCERGGLEHALLPCKRNPPSPTSGQWPPANITPLAWSRPFSSRPVMLGETFAMPVFSSRSIPLYWPRSSRTASSLTLQAAHECPPERIERRHFFSMARRTASTTWDSSEASTTAMGYRLGLR